MQARPEAGLAPAPPRPARPLRSRLLRWLLGGLAVLGFVGCLRLADVDPVELAQGLPTMAGWVAEAFPPSTDDLDTLLLRALETVAIAVVGTTFAVQREIMLCVVVTSVCVSHSQAASPMPSGSSSRGRR